MTGLSSRRSERSERVSGSTLTAPNPVWRIIQWIPTVASLLRDDNIVGSLLRDDNIVGSLLRDDNVVASLLRDDNSVGST